MRHTIRELFNNALLCLPKNKESLSSASMKAGKKFKRQSGIYVFYNSYNEALYVGIAKNIRKRVQEHLKGQKGNKDLRKYINKGNAFYITVFYEDERLFQDVYESYLIYRLQPRFNVDKTGRERV